MRLIPASVSAVGQTSVSSAHVVVCSPVAGLHLSEKLVNGMKTVDHSSPAGTENLALKQPRERGMEPPPAQEYEGASVPAANVNRKPAYSGVDDRTKSVRP